MSTAPSGPDAELAEPFPADSSVSRDLATIPRAARTWRASHFAALWCAMCLGLPTFTLATGFVDLGMSARQAMGTILLGSLIGLVPILLTSHAGARYGLAFPVQARLAYGSRGGRVPAFVRGLTACVWFGSNVWIGGTALRAMFTALWPSLATSGASFLGIDPLQGLALAIVWTLNMAVAVRGPVPIRRFGTGSAMLFLGVLIALHAWTSARTGSWGLELSSGDQVQDTASFLRLFLPALAASASFWATQSLGVADFARHAASQHAQAVGQALALPAAMVAFSVLGLLLSSGATRLYGEQAWDPLRLASHVGSPWVVALVAVAYAGATVAVNLTAHVVVAANAFASLWPRWIDHRKGVLLAGLAGILSQFWLWPADGGLALFGWLGLALPCLGAVAGVIVWDYWGVRRTLLTLTELEGTIGSDTGAKGWNPAAFLATAFGCLLASGDQLYAGILHLSLGGSLTGRVIDLGGFGWFAGFFGAALSYHLLMKLASCRKARPAAPSSTPPHLPHSWL